MACLQRAASAAVLKLLLVAAIGFGPLPALAQIEEIVVSARKIEEGLMEVPLSITALSSETIERAGVVDLNDIAALTPGLSFFSPIGEFLPTPIIRGVAQTQIFGETNVAIFVDGIYVAGREGLNFNFLDVERIETVKGPQSTLYGRNAFSGAINYVTKSAPDTFEVKTDGTVGNDGRLAGKIVVGGPILGDQLKGVISAGYDDFDGSYDDNTGGNDVGGREYKTYLGKLQWMPAANLDVTGTLYYSDDHIDIGPLASLPVNCEDIADPATSDVNSTRDAAFCGDIPELSELNNRLAAAGYPNMSGGNTVNKVKWGLGENRELTRGSLNINWDVDFGTLTWLSGYSKTQQKAVDDGSRNLANGQPFEYCPGGSFSCFGYAGVELALTGLAQPAGKDTTEEWSTELRFTSRLDEPLRGGGGFYYFDSSLEGEAQGSLIATAGLPPDYNENTSRFGPFVGPPDFPLGTIAIGTPAFGPWFSPNGDTDSSSFKGKTDIKSWASFGFLELDFLDDRFTARAELRYTYQEEDVTNRSINNAAPGCPSPPGLGCPDVNPTPPDPPGPNDGANGVAYNFTDVTQTGDGDWDFWTGRLSLQFRPNEDWMIYGTVANGTKSGFIEFIQGNLITGEPFEAVLPVSNEKNTSYELGAKGTLADGRVQLEITGFYTDWSDAALRGTIDRDPNTGEILEQPEAVTTIAGSADIWGWESAINFAPDEFWLFSAGVAYTDAEWDDAQLESLFLFPSFGDAACRAAVDAGQTVPGYCGRIDGQQVARQPPWQGNLSATFTTPIGVNWLNENWDVYGRADFTYEDDWFPQDDNLARIQDHTYVNLRAGLQSERYSVELWVKNLFEEDDASASFRDVFFGNTDNIYYDQPLGHGPNQFFPYRYTVNYPTLRTWGVTVRARFGGE